MKTDANDTIFSSDKHAVLGITLWAILSTSLALLLYGCITQPGRAIFIVTALWLAVLAFFAWLWFGTYYILTDESLQVRCGPVREHLQYADITRVDDAWNGMHTYLTRNRLVIYCGGTFKCYAFPADKKGFLQEICTRTDETRSAQ